MLTEAARYNPPLPTALPPPRAEDEKVYTAALAHVLHRATPSQVAFLEEDPEDWHRVLAAHKLSCEQLIATATADRRSTQARCWRRGSAGKQEWFEFEAMWTEYRQSLVAHTKAVDAALAEVKHLIRQDREDDAVGSYDAATDLPATGETRIHFGRLYQKIRSLEDRVSKLETMVSK